MKIDKLHVFLMLVSFSLGATAFVQSQVATKANKNASAHKAVSEAAFVDSAYRGAEGLVVSTRQSLDIEDTEVIERLRRQRELNRERLSATERIYFEAAKAKATYTIGQRAGLHLD